MTVTSSRTGKHSYRFFEYQVVPTKFEDLEILNTEGRYLAIPGFLSRQFPKEEEKTIQIEYKTIHKDINYYTLDLKPVSFSVLHKEDKTNSSRIRQTRRTTLKLRINQITILVYQSKLKDLQTLVNLYTM